MYVGNGLELLVGSLLLLCAEFGCFDVYVNRAQLSTLSSPYVTSDGRAIQASNYYYMHGDRADVSCVFVNTTGRIVMNFDYAKRPLLDYDPSHGGSNDEWPAHAVGLQIVLQQVHHHQQLSCDFDEPAEGNPMTFTITFVLRRTFGDAYIFKVNGNIIRNSNHFYNFSFFYMKHEYLTIESEAKRDDVELLSLQGNGTWAKAQIMTIRPYETHEQMYVVRKRTAPLDVIRKVTLKFWQLPSYKTLGDDGSAVTLYLPEKKIAMKSYRWTGDELIYYEFEDIESIDIRCSASSKLMSEYGYILNFDGVLERHNRTMTRHRHLSSRDDLTSFVCALMDKDLDNTIRKIVVVFRLKEPRLVTSITTTTTKPNITSGLPIKPTTVITTTIATRNTFANVTSLATTTTWSELTPSPTTGTHDVETTDSQVSTLSLIAVSVVGVLSLALVVACVVWCARKKKRATANGRQSLIENETRAPTENQRGSTNEVSPPVVYDYAYVSNEETLTLVPHHATVSGQGSSAYPRDYTPPEYDYAYDRAPRQPRIYRSFKPPEPARNHLESDYTDHYTEIDEYFIQKQMERRIKKK